MARRAVIIGASSVLGQALAAHLARQEYQLWLTFRSPSKAETLSSFSLATTSRLDVTEPNALEQLAARIRDEWGAVDALVYAPGVGHLCPIQHSHIQAIDYCLSVNLRGAILAAKVFFPLLAKGTAPACLFFSSTMGLVGGAGMNIYSASKAGLVGLARSLAVEWAPRKIRVNAIAPGIIPSPLVAAMFKSISDVQLEQIRARHPLGFGLPHQAAEAAAFLISPQSSWITGIVLPVDGGYTTQ